MKNLASQLIISGARSDGLPAKAQKVLDGFYKFAEGKTFVSRIPEFEIKYISFNPSSQLVLFAESNSPEVTEGRWAHVSQINWFEDKKTGKSGAWIEGVGAII